MPVVPYIALYQRDITYICDGNRKNLEVPEAGLAFGILIQRADD
tara:strand:- start:737 stop:868 length:132 start_codon:yes stop_codon:yes gene_type:complete